MIDRARIPWRVHYWRLLRERSKRALAGWCTLLVCFGCLAATSKTVLDLLRWRDSSSAARAVGADETRGDDDRIDGVVVMQFDVRATIVVLRKIAEGDGPVAVQARNALAQIEKALR